MSIGLSKAPEATVPHRNRLASAERPDGIVWRYELPHTPDGKLLRRRLAGELLGTTS